MATASKRKYLLFSADDGRPDEVKNCAFFASEQGCRNGSLCKFKHEVGPSPSAVSAPAPAPIAKSSNNERPVVKKDNSKTSNNADIENDSRPHTVEKKNNNSTTNNSSTTKVIKTTPSNNHNNKMDEQLRQQQFIFADELEKQKKQLQREYEEKLKALSMPVQPASVAMPVKVAASVPMVKSTSSTKPVNNSNINSNNNNNQPGNANSSNRAADNSGNKRAKTLHPRTPIRSDSVHVSSNNNNNNINNVTRSMSTSSSFQALVDTNAFLSVAQPPQQQDKWQSKQLNAKSSSSQNNITAVRAQPQTSSPFVISQPPSRKKQPQQQQQQTTHFDNNEDDSGDDTDNYNNNNNISHTNQQQNNHNNNNHDDDNDEEDDDFIFQAVNTVVGTGNIPGLAFHSPSSTAAAVAALLQSKSYNHPNLPQQHYQSQQSQQHVSSYSNNNNKSNSINNNPTNTTSNNHNSNNPFRPVESTIQALKSSDSDHALYGSKKAAKVEKVQQKVLVASGSSVGVASTNNVIGHNSGGTGSTMNGVSWEALLLKTRQHPKFNTSYNFATRMAAEPSAWVTAREPGDWCNGKSLLPMLAIDCEMCESTDPITGDIDGTTLIRLSAVSGLDPGVTLIDVLVQPTWPVTNMRTNIHGITADQLTTLTNATNGSQPPCVSLRQAQAMILNLGTASTVIVGQSLHNDLKALKFNHSLVIDTAFLCDRHGAVSESPSLKEIARHMLHVTLPDIHDSIRDAAVAMTIANYIHQNGYPEAVPRWSTTTTASSVTSTTGSSATSAMSAASTGTGKKELLIHRIPTDLSEQDIMNMMMTYTSIMPSHIDSITRSDNNANTANGRTLIHFMSSIHCELAFDSIAGPNRPDKGNNPQKRVYLKSGGYICIRK